jgi:hypothetical protein
MHSGARVRQSPVKRSQQAGWQTVTDDGALEKAIDPLSDRLLVVAPVEGQDEGRLGRQALVELLLQLVPARLPRIAYTTPRSDVIR